MLILTGTMLPSKPRRILSNTHNLPGVEVRGGRACGSPVSPGNPLQDAAWLGARLSKEITCTVLMPMCGE